MSDHTPYSSWNSRLIAEIWLQGILLRRPFRRNPDALIAFIEEFRANRRQN